MRKLGVAIAAVCAVALAGILFLASVVPAWMQQAKDAGRTLAAPEQMLYSLSALATRFGLPLLLAAALGLVAGLFLVVKGGKSRQT